MSSESTRPLVDNDLLSAIEAVLMVVEHPVSAALIAESLGVAVDAVDEALRQLQAEYAGEGAAAGPRERGFVLKNVAGGWRIYSSPRWATMVGRFIVGSESSQLTQAALETLAIVAYRQPATRNQVAHVRGVNVDSVMRNLQARGLIEEAGSTPTGAYLYQTTSYFLECMGFETLEELVPLAPFLPPAEEVEAMTIEVEE